jgi:hypothetical protein
MAVGIAVIGWLSHRYAPEGFLRLPRESPRLWGVVAVLYPLLSVLPQGILFRVFFLHRYEPLFGHGAAMLVAGTIAFSFAHVIFRNAVALGVTALGGLIFMLSQMATGSMLIASLEHAVYGVAAFTFGMGRFLFLGAARITASRTSP